MPQSTSPREGEHPSETTLKQLLNGKLAEGVFLQVERHLASCIQCQSRLDSLVREGDAADASLVALTQAFARKGLTSPLPQLGPVAQRYPDFETLAAYVDGTLSRNKVQEFEALMQQMPRLAQEVAELRALKQDLQAASLSEGARTVTNLASDALSPMIVKGADVSEKPAKTWWAQWRWPMQSLGMATATALFLFIVAVKPMREQLQGEPERLAQRVAQSKAELEKSQSEKQRTQRQLSRKNWKGERISSAFNYRHKLIMPNYSNAMSKSPNSNRRSHPLTLLNLVLVVARTSEPNLHLLCR